MLLMKTEANHGLVAVCGTPWHPDDLTATGKSKEDGVMKGGDSPGAGALGGTGAASQPLLSVSIDYHT